MRRILLVEDEESLRITLAANLELEDYEVVEAENGAEAVERLKTETFDVILSDVRMPKIGGVGLLQYVKQNHPDIPVVLMTAYAQEGQIDQAISGGVHAVLRKPFDFDEAAPTVASAANNRAVLVVDDDATDAETLTEVLRVSGVRCQMALSGQEALRVLKEGRCDVCVTDLVMPGTNGVDVAEQATKLEEKVTVIVCSGHAVPDMIRKVSRLGVFSCLKKPLAPDDLLRTIVKARGGRCAL